MALDGEYRFLSYNYNTHCLKIPRWFRLHQALICPRCAEPSDSLVDGRSRLRPAPLATAVSSHERAYAQHRDQNYPMDQRSPNHERMGTAANCWTAKLRLRRRQSARVMHGSSTRVREIDPKAREIQCVFSHSMSTEHVLFTEGSLG